MGTDTPLQIDFLDNETDHYEVAEGSKINAAKGKLESISYSRRKDYLTCQQKYALRYKLGLEPHVKSKGLRMGSAFSDGLETRTTVAAKHYYQDLHKQLLELRNIAIPDKAILDEELAITTAMLEGYFQRYPNTGDREVEFSFTVNKGYDHRGRIDGIEKDDDGQLWVIEDKFMGMWPKAKIDGLKLDDQVTGMIYAAKRLDYDVVGLKYRVNMKPGMRQRKGDTAAEYRDRLLQDIQDSIHGTNKVPTDKYFKEYECKRTDKELEEFEKELLDFTKVLGQSNKTETYLSNHAMCGEYGGCEFLPLCSGERNALDNYKRKVEA